LAAIEAKKRTAKSSSSPSIHDPAPAKETGSRGKRLHAEKARTTAVEQLRKEVSGGERRVLVLAIMGSGAARHISGHALRRDDSDLSKTEVKSELALSSKQWTKCVLSDMQSLEIQTIKDLETKSWKREHFKMMTEARIL